MLTIPILPYMIYRTHLTVFRFELQVLGQETGLFACFSPGCRNLSIFRNLARNLFQVKCHMSCVFTQTLHVVLCAVGLKCVSHECYISCSSLCLHVNRAHYTVCCWIFMCRDFQVEFFLRNFVQNMKESVITCCSHAQLMCSILLDLPEM